MLRLVGSFIKKLFLSSFLEAYDEGQADVDRGAPRQPRTQVNIFLLVMNSFLIFFHLFKLFFAKKVVLFSTFFNGDIKKTTHCRGYASPYNCIQPIFPSSCDDAHRGTDAC